MKISNLPQGSRNNGFDDSPALLIQKVDLINDEKLQALYRKYQRRVGWNSSMNRPKQVPPPP